MDKKYFVLSALLALLLIVSACAKSPQVSQTDTIQEETNQETVPKPEEEKVEEQVPIPPQQSIPFEIKELFDKSKTRSTSVYYKYRGPETGSNFHEFYIKGNKIKYKPYLEVKTLDQPASYDSIFIDKSARTAASYCEASYCSHKGKKADLNYDQAYIPTVFDWIEVSQAEKIGEEVIESRSTWKIETNKGTIWLDTFYGIPLKAEANGNTYRYEQLAVGGVKDSDVVPSS